MIATINKFLGLNQDTTGETQIALGESPNMINWRVTENYKIRKREGYKKLFNSLGNKNIQGMWYGKINGSYHFLFAYDGKIYEHNLTTHTNAELGTLTDAKTFFFTFNDKVYIRNGHEYKYWDGTTFGTVTGYRPVIAVATPPAGGGTANEEINNLNGLKEQWFSPDGVATVFKLTESNIDSVDFVKNRETGVTYTVTTDYTVNLTTGEVTFLVVPTVGALPDKISIGWKKSNGIRSELDKNPYSLLYGGENDTRVFIYGGSKNRYYYTGLADGLPSAEYFPANSYNDVGSSEFNVTALIKQYDRLIIYTENAAYYSYYDNIIDPTGQTIISFPTYPLNSAVGHVAPGQLQLIQNNPFSIFHGVYEWTATNVRDERNATYISKKVQPSLDEVDLKQAITVDFEKKGEYWLCVGSTVWIFNYRNSTWYMYDNINAKCFLVIDEHLYFGSVGTIEKFDMTNKNDNDEAIEAVWEMAFYDFGVEWRQKFSNKMWVSLNPEPRAKIDLSYQTDKDVSSETLQAVYFLATFGNMNFSNFGFSTNYNPQPFKFKIKAKKFVYFKILISNNQLDENAVVLSINIDVNIGGEAK